MKNISNNIVAETSQPRSWFDLSIVSLIVSNVVVVILVIAGRYDLRYLAFIYYLETIIINIFLPIKVILLKKYYEILRIAIIFGIINILFFGSLFTGFFAEKELLFTIQVAAMIAILLINHLTSFIYNWKHDKQFLETAEWPLRVTIIRLFPLYGVCCFIFFSSVRTQIVLSILFFMLVKTVLDIILHVIEHRHTPIKSKPLGVEPVLVCALFFFMNSVLLILHFGFQGDSFSSLEFFDKVVRIVLIVVEILLAIFVIGFMKLCFKINSENNTATKK